jgi:hypothetical protein
MFDDRTKMVFSRIFKGTINEVDVELIVDSIALATERN